jgi:hypothetical protein
MPRSTRPKREATIERLGLGSDSLVVELGSSYTGVYMMQGSQLTGAARTKIARIPARTLVAISHPAAPRPWPGRDGLVDHLL